MNKSLYRSPQRVRYHSREERREPYPRHSRERSRRPKDDRSPVKQQRRSESPRRGDRLRRSESHRHDNRSRHGVCEVINTIARGFALGGRIWKEVRSLHCGRCPSPRSKSLRCRSERVGGEINTIVGGFACEGSSSSVRKKHLWW